MNEVIFLIQTLVIIGFALVALRLGTGALIAWVSVQALLANLFVLKQITLFGFQVTASDAFAIGSLLGLNFLQEYFDKEEAKKATWVCFLLLSFFVFASQLHLLYQPSSTDTTQSSFLTILAPAPRLLIASMAVFFIVQHIDIHIFTLLKRWLPHQRFAIRSSIALSLSQFLDTTLFTIVGLHGLVASAIDVIVLSFAVKLLVILCFSIATRWSRVIA